MPGSRKELKEVAPTLRATLAAEGQLKAHRDRAQEAQRALLVAADFAAEARRLGLTVREAGPAPPGRSDRGDRPRGRGERRDLRAAARRRERPRPRARAGSSSSGSSASSPRGFCRSTRPARTCCARFAARRRSSEAKGRAEKLAEAVRKGEDPRALARQGGVDLQRGGAVLPRRAARRPGARAGAGPRRAHARRGRRRRAGRGAGRVLRGEAPRPRARPIPPGSRRRGAALEARLLREKRARLWQAWLAAARAGAKIEVNRELLSERLAPRVAAMRLRRAHAEFLDAPAGRARGDRRCRAASRTSCPCAWSWTRGGSTSRPARPGGRSRISARTRSVAVSADEYSRGVGRLRGVVVQGTARGARAEPDVPPDPPAPLREVPAVSGPRRRWATGTRS